MTAWPIRSATLAEMPALARVWAAAWHEAHAAHVPAALLRLRTLAEFEERLERMGDGLRVAGPVGDPLGLCATREDELHQIYLAPAARGSGLAARLLSDGESRLADAGVHRAWLVCIPQNHKARHFYAHQGWEDRGQTVANVDTIEGPFKMPLVRFEKQFGGTTQSGREPNVLL